MKTVKLAPNNANCLRVIQKSVMTTKRAKRLIKIHSGQSPHKPPKVAGTRPSQKVQPAGAPVRESSADG
jgi:hypothetical protein